MRDLITTSEVIDALGGNSGVAALTGAKAGAVSNWRGFVTFPARFYVVMIEALARVDCAASPALWGMAQPAAEAETAQVAQ